MAMAPRLLHCRLLLLLLLVLSMLLLLLLPPAATQSTSTSHIHFSFPSFSQNNASVFAFSADTSGILSGALQVTFDTGSLSLAVVNTSGQITYGTPLRLWHPDFNYTASFNTSFLLNIGPTQDGGTNDTGGGMAFFLSPVPATQVPNSFGAFLGLHNSSFDTHFFAVEFDTFRDSFDPDNNHVAVDVNSTTTSLLTRSLAPFDVTLDGYVTNGGTNTSVWIDYDGHRHLLDVYLANNGALLGTKPLSPVISGYQIDLTRYLPQDVYFGFSASTGTFKETHCVVVWDFTSVGFPETSRGPSPLVIGLGVGVGLFCAVLLVGASIFWFLHLRGTKKAEGLLQDLVSMDYNGPRRFKFKDLKKATNGFSDECKLGEGAFGAVYKGKLGGSGDGSVIEIAVKRLSQDSKQGEKEFMAEIKSIGRMRHKNLVRLLGWSFDRRNGTPLLVYEYMPNGSLDRWLYPDRRRPDVDAGLVMDWNTRFHVLKGVAAGLLYLHEEWEMVVVHRDLKPSNVMLDADFNARLGDFGLAKLIKNSVPAGIHGHGSDHEQHCSTQVSVVAGTPGYIAPECFETGIVTKESDVYSFGAVAMELATGKRSSAENLQWLWKLYVEGKLQEVAEENGLEEYDEKQMEMVVKLVFACRHPQPASRPAMRNIVHLLSSPPSASLQADDRDLSISFTSPSEFSLYQFHGLALDSLTSYPSNLLLPSTSTTSTTL